MKLSTEERRNMIIGAIAVILLAVTILSNRGHGAESFDHVIDGANTVRSTVRNQDAATGIRQKILPGSTKHVVALNGVAG